LSDIIEFEIGFGIGFKSDLSGSGINSIQVA
jgi:hypothetical protein